MKRLTLFLLFLTFASQGWGQVQMDRIRPKGINGTLDASQLCNGSTDLAVCVNNAIALLPNASGCTPTGNSCKQGKILLDGFAGTPQTQATTLTITSPYLHVVGPGSQNLQITCTMNADCWNVRTNPFFISIASRIGGFTLIGQGSGNANAVGLHTGDQVGGEFFDLQIDNFLGANSACVWIDNQLGWFERNTFYRVETGIHGIGGVQSGCKKDYRLTVNGGNNSFGYNSWVASHMTPQQFGFSLESGTLYNSSIDMTANVGTTGTLFSVTTSSTTNFGNVVNFRAECTACSSATATGFSVPSGKQFQYFGSLQYTNGNIVDSVAGTLDVLLPGPAQSGGSNIIWGSSSGSGAGQTICNAQRGNATKACLQTDNGASDNFYMGLGNNLYFDGSNWHCDSDGSNNACSGVLGSNQPFIKFYVLPNNGTPSSTQLVTPANLDNNFKVGSVTDALWTFNRAVQMGGTNPITLGQTTVASLPSAASNPGAMILVTDSTAVASEGQTCVGSSTNKALAVSTGSQWKCF